jgi:putative ABC transport system permease protein
MHFFPILSSLRRHRTAAALIIIEIALTCAIVCNAVFLVHDRIAHMEQPSGVVEDELLWIRLIAIGAKADAASITAQDLSALRAIPGVKLTAVANIVPFGGSTRNHDVSTIPDDPAPPFDAAVYMGSRDLLETMGVRVIAGRAFAPEDYAELSDVIASKATVSSVIITRSVAERLFPGGSALGKKLYMWDKDPQIVVGVVDLLARPNEYGGAKSAAYAMAVPLTIPYTKGGNYLLRVDPARRAEVLAAVEGTLNRIDPNRILLKRQAFGEVRKEHFRNDRAMAGLLVGVSIALLLITALGVVGLASFWVQQRTRQIGIRRALGATRTDILRYFQTENFILTTLGIMLGMALAYALNLWLTNKYQVPRLPAEFLPVGAGLLWLLGQVAVLGPALRASLISPAAATRSV